MSDSLWRPSPDQRNAILLLEVAGLLHDLGKLSSGFLQATAQDRPSAFSYDYESIVDPRIVFSLGPGTVSGRFDKLLPDASNGGIGAPFKDRNDITSSLQAHSLKAWNE